MDILRFLKKPLFMTSLIILSLVFFTSLTVTAADKIIVINPGHQAGKDSGAVNKTTGITEVGLNNALAIKVVTALRENGYQAMLSHQIPENKDLPTLLSSPVNSSTAICQAANKLGAHLLVSIHHNGGPPSANGYEFYWSSYHPSVDNDGIYQKSGLWGDGSSASLDASPPPIAIRSKELAHLFNDAFKNLDYLNSRNRIVERDDAITRKTSMPSVLIEAGFVTNNAESLRLANDQNQQKMTVQIVESINTFFGYDTPSVTASLVKAHVSKDLITLSVSGFETNNCTIKEILFPVWSDKNGQDDLKWYPAKIQDDGSYKVVVNIKDHQKQGGLYQIHCYSKNDKGKLDFLGNTTAELLVDPMTAKSLKAKPSSETQIAITLSGITAPDGLKSISFPVWSDRDGQDDLIWYTATKEKDGSYQATIDIKDHRYDGGDYIIHAYGRDSYDKLNFLGASSVSMTVKAMEANKITTKTNGDGNITARVSGITAPYGLKKILFPVWTNANGQDDLTWYTASKESDGTYQASINVKDHHYEKGSYNIHCYGIDSYDKLNFLGHKSLDVDLNPMSADQVFARVSGRKIIANVSAITAPEGLRDVYFPTWSEKNGQDDIKWYKGIKQSDNSYQITINTADHNNEAGKYLVHCYGSNQAGHLSLLGHTTATITYTPASAKGLSVQINQNIAIVKLEGLNTPNGLKEILIPSWSEKNGQDDLKWYKASKQDDGSYQVLVDAKNHQGDSGPYIFHAYCVENDGEYVFLGASSASIRYVETPIMGQSNVSASQLINYYKRSGKTYPQLYTDLGVDLDDFVDLYIKEAKAEGVRAEVAFAQAMLETGHLQFGKDVKVEQFNFAGLGATGGGIPGFDFSNAYGNNPIGLQMGIRAHIQHLKCYACYDDLNQANVDPRWNTKLRGRALSVEELAGTWAADLSYAPKVKTIMNAF